MRAGDLDRRIVLHRPIRVADGLNEDVPSWDDFTVSAARRDVSDGERIAAAQQGVTLTARFRVRWSARTDQIDATWQLTCEGERFAITAKRRIGRREGIELSVIASQVTEAV